MDWLVVLRDEVAAWLPLLFAILLVLMVYILWRTLQVMPRVTAAKTMIGTSSVTWNDVAGLEEAKEELAEVVDFLRDRQRRSTGHPALRPSRDREDAAREGDRQRSRGAVLRPERVRIRGDVRRARCGPDPKALRGGPEPRAGDRVHRRARRRRLSPDRARVHA